MTSSSAVKIVRNLPNKNILLIPDCNLGDYVAKQVPEKNLKLLQGGCPIHARVSSEDVKAARQPHPNAEVLVHPECTPDVLMLADFIGSTSAIMEYAKASDKSDFMLEKKKMTSPYLEWVEKKFCLMMKLLKKHTCASAG